MAAKHTIKIDIARHGAVLCLDVLVEYELLDGLQGWQVTRCAHHQDTGDELYDERVLAPRRDNGWLEWIDATLHDGGDWEAEIEDCIARELERCLEEGKRARPSWMSQVIEMAMKV